MRFTLSCYIWLIVSLIGIFASFLAISGFEQVRKKKRKRKLADCKLNVKEGKSIMSTKTVTKEYHIKETTERVFKALTEKQELERWFMQEADIELKPGGTIRTNWVPGMGEHGKVREVKPSQLFSFTWEGAFSPTPTVLTFELRAEKDGTLLTFTHSGIGEGEGWEAYTNISKAWDAHLKDLTSWIETGTCPPPGPRG